MLVLCFCSSDLSASFPQQADVCLIIRSLRMVHTCASHTISGLLRGLRFRWREHGGLSVRWEKRCAEWCAARQHIDDLELHRGAAECEVCRLPPHHHVTCDPTAVPVRLFLLRLSNDSNVKRQTSNVDAIVGCCYLSVVYVAHRWNATPPRARRAASCGATRPRASTHPRSGVPAAFASSTTSFSRLLDLTARTSPPRSRMRSPFHWRATRVSRGASRLAASTRILGLGMYQLQT